MFLPLHKTVLQISLGVVKYCLPITAITEEIFHILADGTTTENYKQLFVVSSFLNINLLNGRFYGAINFIAIY